LPRGENEGGNAESVGQIYGFPFHLLVVAGELDLVAHSEGAPRIYAVPYQRFFEVIFPGLESPFLPGCRDGLGGVDLAGHG
jgi:hypothetical protein